VQYLIATHLPRRIKMSIVAEFVPQAEIDREVFGFVIIRDTETGEKFVDREYASDGEAEGLAEAYGATFEA